MDKKPVLALISTKHDASIVEIERMKKGGYGEKEKVMKPVCICQYNQYMSVVDHLDQMTSYTAHVQEKGTNSGKNYCSSCLK